MIQFHRKYNWISLETENSIIISTLVERWKNMLDSNLKESAYHEFIHDNAGFFFGNDNCYLTISKLKLGSDYETDFINVIDQRSNGIIYELIEIEKPNSKLFTTGGAPAKDFSNAIQQIRDWKRFLMENKTWFKKYLPSQTIRVVSNPGVIFTIIIGRRTENSLEIEKRNQIADELKINIRSFDYLTDLLERRRFFNNACLDINGELWLENQIENPFYKAISDSKWRKFCSSKFNWTHFYKNSCKEIVKIRDYNNLIHDFLNNSTSEENEI
ncbi:MULTISPECIES: Shedu anti-phage system protein SduA domain-containing protein [Bacteroides]|jgi:hypothetical protein|uniref:Shedu anti-phage system protein SduA domain-containing protein n=1 Tax=Bacteroides TaxID=816 RepID=UPI00158E987A|nr:Shedu anti-phage system protein SduA domain-containing protein [Bacteroides fragilis]MCM0196076.1 DUF4263 domain-containing protein [Bacteroides fragilis]MCM0201131.1 DUF4263 domain-containing protein [Bacteroides fragilis]MCM0211702.1 DUF4263 domain-containing protein [Bacteroides fragilis]MCM0216161.1 DUF4263 domain-containing protein [Bacteroides fragilis]MCM0242902.1 DUF4263 domain-containing protein [Bacteroides fragilis]